MRSAMRAARTCRATIVHGDVDGETTERALKGAAASILSNPVAAAALAMRLSADPDVARVLGAMGSAAAAGPRGDALDAVVESILDRETARGLARALDRHLPDLATALLHDRDAHMSDELRRCAEAGSVVGVVGIAHMDGIERRFPQATVLHL